MARRLLLIEDDASFARRLRANLDAAGYEVETAGDAKAGLSLLRKAYFDLLVTDIRLPDISGLDILGKLKQGEDGLDSSLPVIVLTSVRDVETAVRAMREGAADYLTKESEKQEIVMRIERVLEQSALLNENRYLRDQLERQDEFREMIGESPAMRAIKDEIAGLAGRDVPALIMGETGVGKELVARALHRTGANPRGPFVDVNCGALPDENLLLSELFGHEKGSFTGATATRRGKFELARGGTLFLDEIGEMPLDAQARVLKAIESLEVTRLGGDRPNKIQCRLLFATNKDLQSEVAARNFRQDLYYRINVLPIHIPPLRERPEDVPLLAAFFAARFCEHYARPLVVLNQEAAAALRNYDWPGNVRELRNVIERLVIRAPGEILTRADVERCGLSGATQSPDAIRIPDEGVALEDVERQLVVQALEKTGYNQKEAAALLKISVDRMNARVKKFGITHPSWRVNR